MQTKLIYNTLAFVYGFRVAYFFVVETVWSC